MPSPVSTSPRLRTRALTGAALLALAALTGCATSKPPEPVAVVELQALKIEQPIPGKPITGSIRFTQRGDEVVARGVVDNLTPGGAHAIYIYDNVDCSAPDVMSAGTHFNPDKRGHSYAGSGHAGDLPQILGHAVTTKADVHFVTKEFTITPGPRSVLGKALIVHRNADSPATQPDGNAGPRQACGMIKALPPAK